jgi:tetratricopeptide (TPR) repeat protein
LGENEKASKEMQLAQQFAASSYDLYSIGNAYRNLNKCKQASRLFKKALESASVVKDQIRAYIGWAHCSEGKVKISYFEKAVLLDPNKTDPDLHFARGKLANARFSKSKKLEDLDAAIQWFNKAIEYRPKEYAYHNDLAIAYMNLYLKKCDEAALAKAMKEFQLSKELHRGMLDSIHLGNLAYEYLIYVVARQRGCEEARSGIYQLALKEIAAGQSVSEETLRYLEESISCYERAITLSPERKDLYENLRSIYHGLNRKEGMKRVEARAAKFGIPLTPIEK